MQTFAGQGSSHRWHLGGEARSAPSSGHPPWTDAWLRHGWLAYQPVRLPDKDCQTCLTGFCLRHSRTNGPEESSG